MLRQLPNALSISRVIMSIALFFIPPMETAFIVMYIAAYATDCMDGNIARYLNACSELGKNLDSLGDILFICVTLMLIATWMALPFWVVSWMVFLVAARVVTMLWIRVGAGHFIMTHSIPNKFGIMVVFLLPFLYLWMDIVGAVVCCLYITFESLYEVVEAPRVIRDGRMESDRMTRSQQSHQ